MGVYSIKGKKGRRYGIRYTDPDTGEDARRIVGSNKHDAEAEFRRIQRQIDVHGTLLDEAKKVVPFFKDWAEKYLRTFAEGTTSYEQKKWQMVVLVEHLGHLRLSAIKPSHLQEYKRWRHERGNLNHPGRPIKARTVRADLELFRHAWNCARREGLVPGENPVSGIRFDREEKRHIDLLTEEEFQAILTACEPRRTRSQRRRARDRGKPSRGMTAETPTLRDFVLFLRYTGCRAGEALNLSVEDVNYFQEELTFRGTKNDENRTVVMTRAPHLVELVLRQQTQNGYIFGGPAHRNRLRHAWERARERAGFPALRFHDFRHMASTWMQRQGVDILSSENLLGHKIRGMLGHYGHATHEGLANAVAMLAKPFLSREQTGRNLSEIGRSASGGENR